MHRYVATQFYDFVFIFINVSTFYHIYEHDHDNRFRRLVMIYLFFCMQVPSGFVAFPVKFWLLTDILLHTHACFPVDIIKYL